MALVFGNAPLPSRGVAWERLLLGAACLPERPMKRLLRFALLSVLLASSHAFAVTDCSRTRTNVERLLCSSDRLAVADQLMAIAFRDAFHRTDRREDLLADQERWLKTVRDACNDVPCLMRAYEERTSELETW